MHYFIFCRTCHNTHCLKKSDFDSQKNHSTSHNKQQSLLGDKQLLPLTHNSLILSVEVQGHWDMRMVMQVLNHLTLSCECETFPKIQIIFIATRQCHWVASIFTAMDTSHCWSMDAVLGAIYSHIPVCAYFNTYGKGKMWIWKQLSHCFELQTVNFPQIYWHKMSAQYNIFTHVKGLQP